ncbi:MAG: TetR/AcrR family transcriptional regulator [Oscillospiraceae bacterium]|nr:TetR/AcrR family transcriptional regulator [Oscillospiraceae bacterium]
MKPPVVKDYLTEALFQLLQEKPYHRITINELVNRAGVCRASFYRNYLTMDQIIEEYLQNLFHQIYTEHPLDPEHMRSSLEIIFARLMRDRQRLLVLGRQGLLQNLQQYILKSTTNEILRFGVMNNRYQPHYFAGASSAMISAWIGYGMEESAAEMADLFIKSLYGYMKLTPDDV